MFTILEVNKIHVINTLGLPYYFWLRIHEDIETS